MKIYLEMAGLALLLGMQFWAAARLDRIRRAQAQAEREDDPDGE